MVYNEYSNVTTLCKIYYFVEQSLLDKPQIPGVTISYHRDLLKEIRSHGKLWLLKYHNVMQEISFCGTIFFQQTSDPCGNYFT